jgi:hypothetical protein
METRRRRAFSSSSEIFFFTKGPFPDGFGGVIPHL